MIDADPAPARRRAHGARDRAHHGRHDAPRPPYRGAPPRRADRRGRPRPRSPRTGASSTPISARSSSLLRLEGIDAFYGDLQALSDVSLEVRDREIVALVGANAAGKSTTLRVISGLVAPRRGRVMLDDDDLTHVPAHARVDRGVVQVPEGRHLFPFMTVTENLLLGAHTARARRRARGDAALRLRAVPGPRRAPDPARGLAVGRRAADVRHRARLDGAAARADARRADARPGAGPGREDLRYRAHDQRPTA